MDRLATWGATALYDAIIQGVDMLGRQAGRRAMVVFSDGEDQGSHVTLEDVERRLQASDVTLYIIAQGRGITHDYLRKVMQRLSTPTGGRVFATDNIDRLQDAFGDLLEELRTSICSAISRPISRRTTPGARSGSRSKDRRACAPDPAIVPSSRSRPLR